MRNFSSLIGTEYGHLLIFKLAMLGGIFVIAGGLQRHLLPMLEAKPSDPTFRSYANRVKVETVLAILIVVVASEMAGLAPPEHENIVWPLPFRFSFAASWPVPWVPTRFLGGTALFLAGLMVLAFRAVPWLRPAWFRLRTNTTLAAGIATTLAGTALAFPAISVQAFPDTYLTTEIPYAVTSVAAGLNHYEQNCTACHGVSGHGDGPLAPSMPVTQKPADLSAPHTALHTPGDFYWWLTHGMAGTPMPGFADVLTNDDRWDIINFLGAFAVGYQARIIEPKINPGQHWLGPVDFQITDEQGGTKPLTDYRRNSAFLVVVFSCIAANIAQETARLEQCFWPPATSSLRSVPRSFWLHLARRASRFATSQPARFLSPIAIRRTWSAALGLFTRTFHNRKKDVVRVPETHVEFLIDRSGYIRARWLPEEDNSWSDPAIVETQIERLSHEPLAPPPPDVHSQH